MEKIKYTFQRICDTIKAVKNNYCFYKDLWDRPQGRAAVSNVRSQAVYLLKRIRPSMIEGDLVIGTGDPATTGEMLGAIGAIYGFLPQKLQITPDFEEKRLEGNLHIKGKIRLIHLLVIAVKIISDKNVRYVVKKIQSKEDVNNEQQ